MDSEEITSPTPGTAVDAYKASIDLIGHEGRTIWSSIGVMVAINGFVLVGVSIMIKEFPNVGIARYFFLAGIALCFVWYAVVTRQFAYYRYWFAHARMQEELAYGETFKMVRTGADYAKGKEVKLTTADEPMQMKWIAQKLKVQTLVVAIILIYGLIYLMLFYYIPFPLGSSEEVSKTNVVPQSATSETTNAGGKANTPSAKSGTTKTK
jgi:hypothetical protein